MAHIKTPALDDHLDLSLIVVKYGCCHGGWETWRSVDHNQWNENHVIVVLGLLNNQAQPCRSFCRHLHLLLHQVEALEPSGQLCL